MKTIIEKDGDGYLAKVEGHQNLFAFAYSEKEAVMELKNVVEMMMDYHLEKVNEERIIKNKLISEVEKYSVQV
jgi:predicted RNase H-like HicB family nuclease